MDNKYNKKRTSICFCTMLLIVLFTGQCTNAVRQKQLNTNAEWMPLFNGKDIDDWIVKIHHYEAGDNFGNTFRVEDSIIKVRYDKYNDFNDQFGHLYYKQPFSYYHLKFDYRFVGKWCSTAPEYTILNSGVMFHSEDPRAMPKEQDWPISIEMQLLAGLNDGKARPTGNMCSPGTHVVYKGKLETQHCIESSSKTYVGEQWVHGELIVLGDSLITHIINGDTVLQYSKPQIGGSVVNNYNPAIKLDGKLLSSGYIALQSEGQPVDFKNIFIRNLAPAAKPEH